MSPLYNPFMRTPDWASGIEDMVNRFLQMYQAKKYDKTMKEYLEALRQQRQGQQQPTNPFARGAAMSMPGIGAGATGQAGMGQPGQQPIDYQQLMQLLKLLSSGMFRF